MGQQGVEPIGWVLYDAGCGVCAWWVPMWAPVLARLGLDVAPLQTPWVASRVGVSPDGLLADIRVLLGDGRQFVGADAYRYVMRRLWWAYPFYLLAVAPALRWLFDSAYRAFADHRLLISTACRLQVPHRHNGVLSAASTEARRRQRAFLTAEWRHLVMLSYEVPPNILEPLVPIGTALDLFEGRALVSVVGFQFLDTRVFGAMVPFHRNFEEVNLRFYVRRELCNGEIRRGVVFVRELVPRAAIALIARLAYNEPYKAVPMRCAVPDISSKPPWRVQYEWRSGADWQQVSATAVGAPAIPQPGSLAAFITEHYWGYTRQRDGSTVEYQVAHPAWRVWEAEQPVFSADLLGLYGQPFVQPLCGSPISCLIAEGSRVIVYRPNTLAPAARMATQSRGHATVLFDFAS
jgi:uncharacterized protein